ncbi:GDSL-type esterase/lipase family protein [Microbulbifer sp. 2304DJ12-6]|uniref:SGNH/GDSL hydrolase family protein n=1 Tax=Microbulbifer sp. 2304DJ12-6 TaxID=3233340 RepID=UPI0039B11F63
MPYLCRLPALLALCLLVGCADMAPEPCSTDMTACGYVSETSVEAKPSNNSAIAYPGPAGEWRGYDRYTFTIQGRSAYVVAPEEVAPGNPWVWRARFPDWHPEADLTLLDQGFHVAYMDVSNLYGSPSAVALWDDFYRYCTESLTLAPKVALSGASRGGLIVYNWAAKNTDKVASIYLESPVNDLKSWPGGLGQGIGSKADWALAQQAYGLNEEELTTYAHNPIDNLLPIATAGIPILHLVDDTDQVVPPAENTYMVESRLRALGGKITIVHNQAEPRALQGHHFPFENPQRVAEFIRYHTLTALAPSALGDEPDPFFGIRDGLANTYRKFQQGGKARVAFLGGSITYNQGWRTLLMKSFKQRFPAVDFDFVAAGTPSMGSTPGAFRLQRDVFDSGPVDLLFVEAAVNDAINNRTDPEALRGVEGIVRQARRTNPNIDIVLMHFVDPDKIRDYNQGHIPKVIQQHEAVATHYGLPSLDLAKEVATRIGRGEFSWEKDFVDLHPSPFGQKLYFHSIQRLLNKAWKAAGDTLASPHFLPQTPLDPFSYSQAQLIPIETLKTGSGFTYVESWRPTDGAATREGFVKVPMLVAESPGAELQFSIEGRGVGLWIAAGPDAGVIEYSIDNQPVRRLDLFTEWSGGLHIPWAYMLDAELAEGKHSVFIKVRQEKNQHSRGHAIRIAHVLVNQ